MKHIFLSASIPLAERDRRFYETTDVIAIRDAVRALATVVLPHARLYWGGHPSITPLIRVVAESLNLTSSDRVLLFQSDWFQDDLPPDNAAFERYEIVPRRGTRDESIAALRDVMLRSARFDAGIFIGGMEGVEVEFEMFRALHPAASVLPVASTGAASAFLYERTRVELGLSPDLAKEYAYPSLFRRLLDLPGRSGKGE